VRIDDCLYEGTINEGSENNIAIKGLYFADTDYLDYVETFT